MTEMGEMQAAIEAVLFVAGEPVSRDKLAELFPEVEPEVVSTAVETVLERFQGDNRGIMVDETAGGVRLVSRPQMNDWLRRFFRATGATKLSIAALETLAIVAYRQPVTGPEIQELRGVGSSGVLKTLLERRLVRVTGRKEVVGKPFLYCTSRDFLVHFGLKNLGDLPPLEDLEEGLGELLGLDGEGSEAASPSPEDSEEVFAREMAQAEALDEARLAQEEDEG